MRPDYCEYTKEPRLSDAYQTTWKGSCGNLVTTDTGNYGRVNTPTFNFCPHCGGEFHVK